MYVLIQHCAPCCSVTCISLTINRTSKRTFFFDIPPKPYVGAHSNEEDVDIIILVAYNSTTPVQIIPSPDPTVPTMNAGQFARRDLEKFTACPNCSIINIQQYSK
jgi:hypothetical protein